VGNYAIAASASGATLGNYNVVPQEGTLSVSAATLTIKANNVSIICGQTLPTTFSGAFLGAKNGETFLVGGSVTATPTVGVGTYVITPSVTGATLNNYIVVKENGILTIGDVIVDANSNVTPQPIKTTATIVTIKVTNSAGGSVSGVQVSLYVDAATTPKVGTTNAEGNAIFNLGVLPADVYKLKAIAGAGCSETTVYMPIYDPNGGFVTGGGWIMSPAGAYIKEPGVTGKANFGFVSKYQKGNNTPTGNTEFQFQAGNLNFNSTAYNLGSLVVASSKAIYKGTGTVNGVSGYSFMVSAVDGQVTGGGGVDKFRIKIWKTTDATEIVYDNGLGADENAIPPTSLSGGSIVIHEAGKKSAAALIANAGLEMNTSSDLTVQALPNPTTTQFTLVVKGSASQPVQLRIVDLSGRVVYTNRGSGNQTFQFGSNLAAGVYHAEVIQGNTRKVVKLLKLRD
jgi:hypothetical protein